MANGVFKSICFLLVGYMTLRQTLRYLNNEDSSSMTYKRFNESPEDRYPTFSICLLSSPFFNLRHLSNKEVLSKFAITANEYTQLLKGNDIVSSRRGSHVGFSNVSQIGFVDATVRHFSASGTS